MEHLGFKKLRPSYSPKSMNCFIERGEGLKPE